MKENVTFFYKAAVSIDRLSSRVPSKSSLCLRQSTCSFSLFLCFFPLCLCFSPSFSLYIYLPIKHFLIRTNLFPSSYALSTGFNNLLYGTERKTKTILMSATRPVTKTPLPNGAPHVATIFSYSPQNMLGGYKLIKTNRVL